jgi:outer membrane protein OmpA-like peptidoglycan-associated protein
MCQPRSFRRSLFAAVALGALAFGGGLASAQTVQVFDQAPSLEQLRQIMIPESRPGLSRSIVMQRPDAARPTLVQPARAEEATAPFARMADPAPATPEPASTYATSADQASARASRQAPTRMTATSAPAAQARMAANQARAADAAAPDAQEAGVVGFRINFALDSAELPASAAGFLDRVAELLREQPQLKLRVEGHTDALGTADYNLSLSERRALSAAAYLVERQGIAAERLELIGKGMTEPLMTDPYAAKNRRVQFVRIG